MSFDPNNLEINLRADLGINQPQTESMTTRPPTEPPITLQPQQQQPIKQEMTPKPTIPGTTQTTFNNNKSNNNGAPSKPPSNEFVRKLYNILESNLYPDIVRWTDNGDSFVVLDTGKFTTQILPNHFKHSNFASFVRQLNKYDFHKIKKKPNEEQRSQTGELSWEFKHPFFKIHDVAGLDRIKRKLSNAKRAAAAAAAGINNGTPLPINAVSPGGTPIGNGTSASNINIHRNGRHGHVSHGHTRHEILNAGLSQLGITKEQFLSHTVSRETYTTLRKRVENLEKQLEISKNEIFIGKVENQKLNSKYNTVVESLITFKTVNENLINNFNILCSVLSQNGIKVPEGLYEQTNITPNDGKSISDNNNNIIKSEIQLLETPNGITSPDQNRMLSFNMLANTNNLLNNQMDGLVGTPLMKETRKDIQNTVLRKGFHVLLVEDDTISIQLCSKFLRKYGCTVEVVTDGLSAISTLEKTRFDLVLMDIVMPNLDGATATSIIRNFDNQTPIIAMTGNIDDQDLITYLQHGMNDILAKPFTRDDLHTMLVRYLKNREPLSEQQRMQSQPAQSLPQQPQQLSQNVTPGSNNTQSPMNQSQIGQMNIQPPQQNVQTGGSGRHTQGLVHDNNPSLPTLNMDDNLGVPMTQTPHALLADTNFLEDEHIDKKPHL